MGDRDADRLLWLDLETTGLEHDTCAVLEVAWYLTDWGLDDVGHRLEQRFAGVSGPVATPAMPWDEVMLEANDAVHAMHKASGLEEAWTAAAQQRGPSNIVWSGTELEEIIRESITPHLPGGGRLVLAGDGVAHFDRIVLEGVTPTLADRFHYRPQDVSPTVRLLSGGRWGPADLLERNPAVAARVRRHATVPTAGGRLPDVLAGTAAHRAAADVLTALTAARMVQWYGGQLTWLD